jgi:MFS family permease
MSLSGEKELPIGYIQLLKQNVNFRRLWLGQVVSDLGDWFNTIALYILVMELSGSELALGIVFVTKLLPFAFAAPFAGMIADRFDRKTIMIVSDILRGIVVLGFLLVKTADFLWLLYLLIVLQVVISAFFTPAKSATIPNIASKEELMTANALSSISWSIVFALGAALGGLVTEWFGVSVVFVINGCTYFISALLISGVRVPPKPTTKKTDADWLDWTGLRQIAEGFRYMAQRPPVFRYVLVKGLWGISGGGLMFISVLLSKNVAIASSIAIGFFYAARALGTAVGPILSRRWFPNDSYWSQVIGWSFIFGGVTYLFVGITYSAILIALLMFVGHMAAGSNWVLSTTYLQKRTEDAYRGRVFASESILYTFIPAISQLLTAFVIDRGWFTVRETIGWLSVFTVIVGLLWLFIVIPMEKRENSAAKSV